MEKTMTKEKIIEAVKNIPIVAEKNSWSVSFDRDEGALFYAPTKIPNNSELHQVTDEYAIYLDKDSNPSGVVVEYFKGNFLKHHKLFNRVAPRMFGNDKSKKDVGTIKPKQKDEDTVIFKALLENTLIKEASTNLIPA